MALVRGDRDGSLDRVAWILAGFVPFFAYVATASGFAFWLDSGELLAAGVDLDIAHPPGHPLSSLVSRAFAFLPIGPLAFRVAVGQAACAAIAGMFFHRAVVTTLRAQGVRHDAVAVGTGLGASWLVTLSYGFWIQAVRPEVYALEAMVLAVVLERVVALEARWPTLDLAPLHHAGLAFGLGLANHHFMALLTVPAFLPTVVRVWRARGTRAIAISAGAVLVGLSTYVYLPLRASTAPPMDLGHPTDPSRFYWVVSARAFQSTHALESDPLAIRLMDVTVALAENLHVVTLLAALAGAYVLVRADGARRIGLVWIATALFGVLGRAMLGFVSGNPDALGYLMPTFFAIVALAASFFGAVTVLAAAEAEQATLSPRPSRPPLVGAVLALVTLAAGAWQLREGAASASLRTFHSTDTFDGPRYRDLPARAVVLAHGPQTVFRYFSARAIEAKAASSEAGGVGSPTASSRLTVSGCAFRPLTRARARMAACWALSRLARLASATARRTSKSDTSVTVPWPSSRMRRARCSCSLSPRSCTSMARMLSRVRTMSAIARNTRRLRSTRACRASASACTESGSPCCRASQRS